jgi:methylisocitrate lyase
MTPKAAKFRKILEQPDILVLPGVYDCVGAKLVEQAGFGAVFTSGFGVSAAALGKPDYGFLTATEMMYAASRITAAVDIPLVADIDTGYGNPLNVYRTVTELVRHDIAGFILEDQEWPKKCGHFAGKRVIPMAEHVEKVRAAAEACGDSGLVMIGRTDARAPCGLDEAIARGHAYYEAGADVVFIEAPQNIEDLQTIADAFEGIPLFANMIEGGRTPLLPAEKLRELGCKIVVYPLSGLFSAAAAIGACLQHLREHGTTEGFEGPILSFSEFEQVVEVPKYRAQEDKFDHAAE